MSASLSDFVDVRDAALKRKFASNRIPMNTLIEAYLDEKVDLKVDMHELIRNKSLFVNYRMTANQVRFLFEQFIPSVVIHSKKQDHEKVTEHYDRGNDFFQAFLGDVMVYTSGFFLTGKEDIELAQRQKLDYVGQKLQLKPGERLLDIGCGWGTLVGHMAERFGVDATGVTISKNQAQFATDRLAASGLEKSARVLTLDYRDIPNQKFDKVSVLEMAEHVGIKNFQKFLKQVNNLMTDDGLLYLQIAGLRRNWNAEDITWGLFMSKYIFPGADASMPLSFVVNNLEKAGFEIHGVENIGIHYSYTIERWYRNWVSNEAQIKASYGVRWYRLFQTFLAWSVLISEEGGATCFQIVANKNTSRFNRHRWVGEHLEFPEEIPAKKKQRKLA